jgi:hypothetical protein
VLRRVHELRCLITYDDFIDIDLADESSRNRS